MGRLQDRTAIVTGGADGIGKHTAMRLVDEGAIVFIADINEAKLEATAAEMNRVRQGCCTPVRCDVTVAADIANLFRKFQAIYPKLDILVNNAGGGMHHPIHLLELSEDQWDKVVDLNLKSVFLCSQHALRMMVAQGSGAIVNVASQAGRYGSEMTYPHYSAAKAGVLGLTRHMAREFGPHGIRINAIAPGWCMSGERIKKHWEEKGRDPSILKQAALQRASTPDEQAAVIAFLCSDDSSYIAGATLDVSGGRVCF